MSLISISANKLAELITAKTPAQKRTIARALWRAAHSPKGYAPHYPAFTGPAKRFLAGGAKNPAEVAAAIERMRTRTGKPWLDIDSKITAEAFKALLAAAPAVHALDLKFFPRAPRTRAKIRFHGVDVTVTPDLMTRGKRNGVPVAGALRFYVAKGRAFELGPRAAELVAVMQHHWLASNWTGGPTPDPSLCLVLECFQGRITPAPADTRLHLAAIQRGCRELADIWHQLDTEEAA